MTTVTSLPVAVIGGVDTHADVHVAAACDPLGGLLGTRAFATTPAGYRALLAYLTSFGPVRVIGVEGTGSYGSGLARHLAEHGVPVIEVDRPTGRSAAGTGRLQVGHQSAIKARTQALNQAHALILTAPEPARSQLRDLSRADRLAVCAG